MVKVGNSECEFLKWTPLSRISAIAGAVCGVTMRPRKPSGTNRIKLRGVAFCADAAVAVSAIRLADSNTVVRRIRFSPSEAIAAICRCLRLVLLCDRFVTCAGTGLKSRDLDRAIAEKSVLTEFGGKHRRPDPVLLCKEAIMSKFHDKA